MQREQAVREINSWGNKEIRGLIPTIVDSELSQDTVIILENVLNFKGIWSIPFDANLTKRKDFHLINGKIVSVQFMTNPSEFSYGSFEDFKILKIRYECEEQSNKFAMYIFLPDRSDGLRDLLDVFHSNHALFHGEFDLYSRKLDEVWIPKFNISYKLEGLKVLKEMGLTLLLKKMNEDLNGILDSRSACTDMLNVSQIIQKSFIQVDERGTEAASSTWDDFVDFCERSPLPPANFVADHPFMFMMREDTSRAIFFVGVVLNPM